MSKDSLDTWAGVTEGIVRKFEVAAAFNGRAVWNAEGSAACASIIKKMAKIIDDEIVARSKAIAAGEAKPE